MKEFAINAFWFLLGSTCIAVSALIIYSAIKSMIGKDGNKK